MSLNNISLPPQLLAHLYQQVLVNGDPRNTATAMPVKAPVAFLGKNGKNILILVHKTDVPFLPDAELSFLTKILMACQFSLLDVAIVNQSKLQPDEGLEVLQTMKPRFLILFDVDPAFLNLPKSPLFAVQSAGERQYVTAPALAEIEKTKETKSALWMCLKQLFNI